MYCEFLLQLLATFLGVLLAFYLSYLYENYKEKQVINNQIISLLTEIKINSVTIKQLKEGIESGFTLDRLQDDSTDSLLYNPKLYTIYKKHLDLIIKVIAYKKVVYIANRMIDFCHEYWKNGTWLTDLEKKKIHVATLEEKLNKVTEVANKIEKLISDKKLIQKHLTS